MISGLLTRNGVLDEHSSATCKKICNSLAVASIVANGAECGTSKKCLGILEFKEFLADYQETSLSDEEIMQLIQVLFGYWDCTLGLYTGVVHWGCTLGLYTGVVHWCCLYTGVVHWRCTLGLYTGVVHWGCTLALYTGVVHWGCTLVLFVHRGCTLGLYTGVVHWGCTLGLYIGVDVTLVRMSLCREQCGIHLANSDMCLCFIFPAP